MLEGLLHAPVRQDRGERRVEGRAGGAAAADPGGPGPGSARACDDVGGGQPADAEAGDAPPAPEDAARRGPAGTASGGEHRPRHDGGDLAVRHDAADRWPDRALPVRPPPAGQRGLRGLPEAARPRVSPVGQPQPGGGEAEAGLVAARRGDRRRGDLPGQPGHDQLLLRLHDDGVRGVRHRARHAADPTGGPEPRRAVDGGRGPRDAAAGRPPSRSARPDQTPRLPAHHGFEDPRRLRQRSDGRQGGRQLGIPRTVEEVYGHPDQHSPEFIAALEAVWGESE